MGWLIERIMILESGDVIRSEHLPPEFTQPEAGAAETEDESGFELEGSFREIRQRVVSEFEEHTLRALLDKHWGDVRDAAVEARLNLTEFRKLMRKYGIEGRG